MKRVRASGVLMIFTTVSSGLGPRFFFHPIGFCCVMVLTTLQLVANSWLQIGSFAPAGGSTDGPLLALARFALLGTRRLKSHKKSNLEQEELRRVDSFLIANAKSSPTLTTRRLKWPRRLSHYMERSSSLPVADTPKLERASSSPPRLRTFLSAVSSSFLFRRLSVGPVKPDVEPSDTPQDDLDPWERLGVTVALLEAFIRTNNIGESMTSGEVCETYIKPATQSKEGTFMDLLVDRYGTAKDPTLTKLPGFFVSHWCVRRMLERAVP